MKHFPLSRCIATSVFCASLSVALLSVYFAPVACAIAAWAVTLIPFVAMIHSPSLN